MLRTVDVPVATATGLRRTRRLGDRLGDGLLHALTAAAALIGIAVIFLIIWQVARGAWPAMRVFHLSFLWHNQWNAVLNEFGARDLIIGTVVTSFGAMLLAAPLSIAIGLFLSELAPASVRDADRHPRRHARRRPQRRDRSLGHLRALRRSTPSTCEPFLSSVLGWIPIFAHGGDKTTSTVFTAIIVLTIMIIPITASICRELFLAVPAELEEGAIGLGATRWEMVRTVIVPSVKGGVRRGGCPRAGPCARRGDRRDPGDRQLHSAEADALRARGHDREPRGRTSTKAPFRTCKSHRSIYLAFILLVITFLTNLAAQRVVKRFEYQRTGGS